jgi:hypothetical protein
MKKQTIVQSIILFFLLLSIMPALRAQQTEKQQKEPAKEAAIKSLVESQRYMFIPQTMMPQTGQSRQVTYGYDFRVIKDTINAYLPYVGKAFVATYGGGDGAISFKTTGFDYVITEAKKGGWNVTITPKNITNVRQLMLRITVTGNTTIQISSNTRDMISFNGYLQPLP